MIKLNKGELKTLIELYNTKVWATEAHPNPNVPHGVKFGFYELLQKKLIIYYRNETHHNYTPSLLGRWVIFLYIKENT